MLFALIYKPGHHGPAHVSADRAENSNGHVRFYQRLPDGSEVETHAVPAQHLRTVLHAIPEAARRTTRKHQRR